jgi:hypothetical protein
LSGIAGLYRRLCMAAAFGFFRGSVRPDQLIT